MVEERWMIDLGKQYGRDWFTILNIPYAKAY